MSRQAIDIEGNALCGLAEASASFLAWASPLSPCPLREPRCNLRQRQVRGGDGLDAEREHRLGSAADSTEARAPGDPGFVCSLQNRLPDAEAAFASNAEEEIETARSIESSNSPGER